MSIVTYLIIIGSIAFCVLLVAGLCRAAANADEIQEAEADEMEKKP